MDRLFDITDIIDTAIGDPDTGINFKDIRFFRIARLQKKDKVIIPVSYQGFGDMEFSGFQDTNGLNIYHRILSQNDDNDFEAGYGRNPALTENFPMTMVVFGNMRKIDDTNIDINYRIADEIVDAMPVRFSKAQSDVVEARWVLINVNGRNFLKEDVFATELPDNDFNLKPENILFAINYTIQARYS